METLTLFDNTLTQWGFAILVCAGTVAGLKILQAIGIKNLHGLASRMKAQWLENLLSTLGKTKILLLLVIGVWAGSFALSLPEKADTLIRSALVIVLMMQVGLWAVMFLNAWIDGYRERNRTTNPAALTSISAVGFIGKIVIWSAVLLMVLYNLGVDITALIAGLGIGGIAVALAVQNILGDLFASMTIVLRSEEHSLNSSHVAFCDRRLPDYGGTYGRGRTYRPEIHPHPQHIGGTDYSFQRRAAE